MQTSHNKKVTVKIKVHPIVYDFYFAQYGEIFDIKDDSVLAMIIPHVLSLKPKEYEPVKLTNYKPLNIIIHDFRFGSAEDVVTTKRIHVEGRRYVSDRNQYYISRFLDNVVKNIFHNYMMAYMRSNPTAQQKDAILDFCLVYSIEENKINYDMLKKSWDRSGQKAEWKRLASISSPGNVVNKC